ncbi:hypothetical protein ACLRGI_22250 [Paenarthrobacter nitroguajacolicus]|uniref:hypothetical protein n=1 Tax=Paenarthrobacter nitroguajacolicus TaxID=211146 RepID=UPI003AEC7847
MTRERNVVGLRIVRLSLKGSLASSNTYEVDFRQADSHEWRPLAIVAGPSSTGKTSVADFIRYNLGAENHPQHPEIVGSVGASVLEVELRGETTTIERYVSGSPSKFASVWRGSMDGIGEATESRLPIDPPSAPDSLSQLILSSMGLEGMSLPEAPTQAESAVQTFSIRDLTKLFWLPNERLDSKNLLFEHSNYTVAQKFQQTVDLLFEVSDNEGVKLAAQLKGLTGALSMAEQNAESLRRLVEQEHPLGALVLETDLAVEVRRHSELLARQKQIDLEGRNYGLASANLRAALADAEESATRAQLRVRDRKSLIERLAALRSQYADDQRKLVFLKQAERLFDPLHVKVCPACLSALVKAPEVLDSSCSLCHSKLSEVGNLTLGGSLVELNSGEDQASERGDVQDLISAELRATSRRLVGLNEYWDRLRDDMVRLQQDLEVALNRAAEASRALNEISNLPAPYLAARDQISREINESNLSRQSAETGLRLWRQVEKAEANVDILRGQIARLRAERNDAKNRPDRTSVVRRISERFGKVLQDIGYPKLENPFLDDKLIPHVRNLDYTHASSGGQTLISLAWYLAVWEVSFEEAEHAPGLLIIDSPQKNLGHSADPNDPDFADTKLVQNFYRHAEKWLNEAGLGAQLIVIDNSPPESVRDHVVVRFTRDPHRHPYGLIHDATT